MRCKNCGHNHHPKAYCVEYDHYLSIDLLDANLAAVEAQAARKKVGVTRPIKKPGRKKVMKHK